MRHMNGISIVIPAYNEEKYLPETLRALALAQLAVARSPWSMPSEVIVVDNASTDRTREVAESLGARVVSHSVRNISSVRNAGLQDARFDLVFAIDADCTIEADALQEIVSDMSRGDSIGGCLNVQMDSPKLSVRLLARALQLFVLFKAGHNGAVFYFLRDEALAIGGFDEKHLVAEDSVFSLAMRERARHLGKKFGRLPHVIVKTKDRKESSFKQFLEVGPKVWRSYHGEAVDKKHFDYWYNPKR